MEPKLRECHRVLKPTGSIYLHCDVHADAHLRILMDRIFGENNFKNEIIWQRTFAHNDPRKYGNIADTILFYTKTDKYTWHVQYTSYSEKYIENFFKYKDARGRYRLVALTGPGTTGGESGKAWKEYAPSKRGRHWAIPSLVRKELNIPDDVGILDALNIMEQNGRIVWSKNHVPSWKEYLDEMPGVPLQNIWTDISPVSSQSHERLGYPTQKPLALLERIIKASSDEGDIILDPFCGCGTAIAVAQKLKRKWVGIDVSPTACKLMQTRIRKITPLLKSSQLVGMPQTKEEILAMQPFEFQNWVVGKLGGRQPERLVGDMGIDGYLFDGSPIQVKQSEHVGRNVIDNFETAMDRVKKPHGVIIAISFGKGAYEEVARVKNESGHDIELMTVDDIIALP